MADEGFIINLGFNTEEAEKDAKHLKDEVRKIFEEDRGTVDTAILNLDNQMRNSVNTAEKLERKLAELESIKTPTEDYSKLQTTLDKTASEFDKLVSNNEKLLETKARFEELGQKADEYRIYIQEAEKALETMQYKGKDLSVEDTGNIKRRLEEVRQELPAIEKEMDKLAPDVNKWEQVEIKIEELGSIIRETENEMQHLVDTGAAFKFGKDSEEYVKTKQQLADVNSKLNVQLIKHRQITNESHKTNERIKSIAKNMGIATAATLKLQAGMKNVSKASKNALRNILRWALGISSVFVLINKMRSILKEGMSQVYESKQFTKLNDQIDELKAKLATLKNAFVGAFLPLIQTVIPYIQKFVEWLTKAVDLVAQFIAALMGRTTYYKALKKETDELKKQNKEREKSLSKLDKLNVLTSKQTEDESGGTGPLFEEVPIDNKILDLIKKLKDWIDKLKSAIQALLDYLSKLKDAFLKGFFDALGNWKQKLAGIIQSLKNIWDLLKEIFTDPEVMEAMDKWAQSFMYMLGALAGLFVNLGLTLAQMFIGGFEKFLESKKEDIKQWLVDIFNVGTEINEIWGETFVSLSRIIDTFAKENGQRLVAGIMSVAYEIWSNLLLLAAKLFRDISNIITLWIRENEEKISQAIDNILGFGAGILESVQGFLDQIFEYAQQFYDEHIKPLFDKVAEEISNFIGGLIDIFNNDIKPFLDELGVDFQELSEIITPIFKTIFDTLGPLIDLLSVLFDAVIKPRIELLLKLLPQVIAMFRLVWTVVGGLIKIAIARMVNIFQLIGSNIQHMIQLLSDFIRFISAILSGDWATAWDAAGSIVNDFKDWIITDFNIIKSTIQRIMSIVQNTMTRAWQNILNIVRPIVNTIKSMISSIINAVNTAKQKLSELGSGGVSGVLSGLASKFKAPGAATGAVIPPQMSNRVFTVGDNNSETEVISPLSTMKQAMVEALQQSGINNTGGGDIVINIDGREVFRVVQKQATQYSNQHGGKPAFQGA